MRSQPVASSGWYRTLLVGLLVCAMLGAGTGIVAASAGEVTTTLSPDETTTEIGETETFDIVVDGAESDVGAYAVNLTVSETDTAEITAIAPAGEPLYEPVESIEADGSSATLEVIYGDESLAANESDAVTVGTVIAETTGVGTVTVDQTVTAIGDADGESYTVTGSESAELTAVSTGPTELDGSGTETDPYLVTNVSELQSIQKDLTAHYELAEDIDASETAEWNERDFEPIGSDTAFTGSFDGAGYSIAGLTIERPNETNVALFAELDDGGTVENLAVQQATVSGDTFVGIVFGANEGGTVRDVSVQGTVDGSKDVGTVGGSNHETVTNVTATGAVSGSTDVGGLVGHNSVSGLVTKSSAAVTVDGTTRVGGLVGGASGRIYESAATGDVSGAHRVGGLAGNQVFGVINETYATGFVESANVDDTTAVAEPTAMGGLVGENNGGTLRNSYTIGSDGVNGSVDEGFIVGNVTLNGTVVDTYGELPTSNPDKGALTTEEMTGETAAETMAGFDFVETWSTTDGFPELIALDPELQQQPAADFDIEPTTPKPNQAVTFTDLSNDPDGTIESRSWTFGDGAQSTGSTPEHSYSSAGNYTVELTVTDNHGNTNSTSKTVSVGVLDLPGSGSRDDPYIISNASELQAISQSSAAHYRLGSDIDAVRTVHWNDGAGFAPIESFSGTFDGAGYVISGLTVDRPTKNGVGLFAALDNTGTVKNVTLEDVAITGTPDAGGLVGDNSGTVTDTSVTGTVTDVDRNQLRDTGGLVGSNSGTITNSSANVTVSGGKSVGGLVGTNLGTVNRSSATGAVNGTESVGGLVGTNLATISETYATGKTTGNTSVGGLVGESIEDIGVPITTTHSYWDTESTGQEISDGGTGLTTAEMTGETATETMSGFDFDESWETTKDYPAIERLSAERAPPSVAFSYEPSNPTTDEPIQFIDQSSVPDGTVESVSWEFGDGSESTESNTSHMYNSGGTYYIVLTVTTDDGTTRSAIEPITVTHIISTASELQAVADDPDGQYRLGSDVDATETADWNDGAGFEPIDSFSGSFNGAGHSVDGLTVDRPDTDAVGLFSTIEGTGTVTNTTLTNVTVRGDRYVGGLAGDTRGSVERSHVSGTVEGSESVGGLLGLHINAGYVRQSSADVTVVGGEKIGGLIGFSTNAEPVNQSFATGTVEGEEIVGGLVGDLSSDATVIESYAAGTVSGTDGVGGLTGHSILSGSVNRSYWDVETTEQSSSEGGTALTSDEMTGEAAPDNMTGFDFETTWAVTESYPELRSLSETTENVKPIATNVSITTSENTTVAGTFNATSPTDGNLSYTVTEGPAAGTVSTSEDMFIYTPETAFTGTETFSYTVSDTDGQRNTAVVTVTVVDSADQAAAFEIDSVTTNTPLNATETLTATAEINNTGMVADTQTVSLTVDGTADPVDSQQLTLNGGDSQTISLDWNSSVDATSTDSITISTANDTETVGLTVGPPLSPAIGNLTIAENRTNETITVSGNIESGSTDIDTVELGVSAKFTAYTSTELITATVIDGGEFTTTVSAPGLVSDGQYAAYGRVTDSVGTTVERTNDTVSVDTTPPAVRPRLSGLGNDTASLRLTADEPYAVTDVDMQATAGSSQNRTPSTIPSGLRSNKTEIGFDGSQIGTDDTSYQVAVTVEDALGNQRTESLNASVTGYDVSENETVTVDPPSTNSSFVLETTATTGSKQAAVSQSSPPPANTTVSQSQVTGQFIDVEEIGVSDQNLTEATVRIPLDQLDLPTETVSEDDLTLLRSAAGEETYSSETVSNIRVETTADGKVLMGEVPGFSTVVPSVTDDTPPTITAQTVDPGSNPDPNQSATVTFEYHDELSAINVSGTGVSADGVDSDRVTREITPTQSETTVTDLDAGETVDIELTVVDTAGNSRTATQSITVEDPDDSDDSDDSTDSDDSDALDDIDLPPIDDEADDSDESTELTVPQPSNPADVSITTSATAELSSAAEDHGQRVDFTGANQTPTIQQISFETKSSGRVVRTAEYDQLPSDLHSPDGELLTSMDIVVPADLRETDAVITARLDRQVLGERRDAEDIIMLRYSGDDWEPLETTPVVTTADEVVVEAETPGFSYFAVVSDDGEVVAGTVEQVVGPADNRPLTEDETPAITPGGVVFALILTSLLLHRRAKRNTD